jgi:hypothetical protein
MENKLTPLKNKFDTEKGKWDTELAKQKKEDYDAEKAIRDAEWKDAKDAVAEEDRAYKKAEAELKEWTKMMNAELDDDKWVEL